MLVLSAYGIIERYTWRKLPKRARQFISMWHLSGALLLALLASACSTVHVVSAVGARPTFEHCFTIDGVDFYRDAFSTCPKQGITEHVLGNVDRLHHTPLAGLRIYVVDALVDCGGDRTGIQQACMIFPGNITIGEGHVAFYDLLQEMLEYAAIYRAHQLAGTKPSEFELERVTKRWQKDARE